MEKSTSSSMNKALSSKEATYSEEESGWTTYFEEFMASEKRRAHGCTSSVGGGGSSSMISDAASYAAWRPSTDGAGPEESCKKLSFRSRKEKIFLGHDASLEDTASSPINSPKVCESNHLGRKEDDKRDASQEKSTGYQNHEEPRRNTDEMIGLDFIEKTNECSELKKRGLRLVPFSMLLDYLDH